MEQAKIEAEQEQEVKEMPSVQELSEKIKQEMSGKSEEEVGGFKADG
jgi:hypothetical protein